MLRLLADENFNGDIVRALLLRQPDLDIGRVQDVGVAGASDPDILTWVAANNRIVLIHDRATLPDFAFQRLAIGGRLPGVFILNDRFPTGDATREILLIVACSEQEEWIDRVVYLPL